MNGLAALVLHLLVRASASLQSFEDSSFQKWHRFSNKGIVTLESNFIHLQPEVCPTGFKKFHKSLYGTSLENLGMDSICVRRTTIGDTGKNLEPYHCPNKAKPCIHKSWSLYTEGWSSLKSYRGCRSTSAEYNGSADFALNLNDSLALAVTVSAIAGRKHLGTHFLDSIPDDQNPIYTAQIATSRMLCAPGKTEPFHNSERKQFHFGTYPQFRLFRMGGKGILVMRGRDRQDPSRNRVIETTIDLYGMLQSREYFDKTLPDGKHFPSADYGIENGILYRKIVNPQSANATVMDQGWVGLWVDRLLVPDYLKADSTARAQEDSARKSTNPVKTTP